MLGVARECRADEIAGGEHARQRIAKFRGRRLENRERP
jgi:hypothetical protein